MGLSLFRNTVQTHAHKHASIFITMNTHATLPLWAPPRDWAGKSSRLTKSPQALRCRRERRLPLKAQTSLNPENSLPRGVEPRTLGAIEALVTTRLHVFHRLIFLLSWIIDHMDSHVLWCALSFCKIFNLKLHLCMEKQTRQILLGDNLNQKV